MRNAPVAEPAGGRLRPYVPRVVLSQLAAGDGALTQTIEGTVVFVDVSGFTKLSERLARQGREGAEYLADAIGGCFSSLLALAYANGGSLLKFGGDALLLLFDGADHVERGVRSAAGMRRTLREVGRIDAGGAKVNLRMSVGVHTGEFHFFLVGDSHRELLVTGPAASRVVHMEGAADAGEIVLSPELCAHLPRGCVGEAKGPGRLLVRPPSGVSMPPHSPELVVDDELVAGCLSTGLRSHVIAGVQAPEHRTVTVAFIHFDGTDDLIENEGLGPATAALSELVTTVQRAADEHGVCFLASDVDADGGKLILTAGAPRVLEDDEERMLLTLRRVADADLRLPVRIGVNRGPVFAGDVGPHFRRTYTVMGDAVNLSARLMAKAPEGGIYASGSVLQRSATQFELEELEPFMVKGKAKPVQAWSVGEVVGARSAPETDEGGEVPLLGREREVAAIEAAVASAAEGGGRLIEVVGEAGIGKTRLVEEIRARAGSLRRIEAPCEAYTSSSPYATWRPVLRAVAEVPAGADDETVVAGLRRVAGEDPALLPYLPLVALAAGVQVPATPEVEALADEFRQSRLHEAVVSFLRLRFQSPTLLEVEHAHHMDSASADLLEALAGRLGKSRWIVAVTRRDVEGGFQAPEGPAVVRLSPQPLEAGEAEELARCFTRRTPLPPHALLTAAERSGGNPAFLRELLRATIDGVEDLPDSIESAASARIDRLNPAQRAVVRRASVLGAIFDLEQLEDVLGDMPLPDDNGWKRLGPFLVRDGTSVRFARPAVREAAYAGLPFRVRRELHAIAGHRLEERLGSEAGEAADILSLHFLLAGQPETAWRYALAAARRARDAYAYAVAVTLYRRALDACRGLSVDPEDLVETWEGLATAYERLGQPEAATEAFKAAERLLVHDPARRAALLQRRTLMTMDAGGIPQAVRCAHRGLRLLEGAEERRAAAVRSLLVATLATVRQRQGRTREAIALCRRAIAEARESGEDRALARASSVLDWALVESGRPAEAVHASTALDIYRRLGDLQSESIVLGNLGGFAYRDGRWDDAVSLYSQSGEASRRCGDVVGAAISEANLGELRSDQGRLDDAHAALESALQVFDGTGNEYAAAYTTAMLGRVVVRSRRFEEGGRLYGAALERFAKLRADQDAAMVEALVCEQLSLTGSCDEAGERAERLLDAGTAGARLIPLLHRLRAAAPAAQGRTDEAEAALRDALAEARAHEDTFEVAATLYELAMIERASEAEREECDRLLDRLSVVQIVSSLSG